MLQPTSSKKIGRWTVERLPKVSTVGITEEGVQHLINKLKAQGYELIDVALGGDYDNDQLGILPNGEVVVIDSGAVQRVFLNDHTVKDAAMSGRVPLSQRFSIEIDDFAGNLYKENRGAAIRFSEKFRDFLDRIDPDLAENMNALNFYDIAHRFEAIFQSGHFLDEDILRYSMAYFNDQARRLDIFKDAHGLRVQRMMHRIIRHMIAGYYLRLLMERKEVDREGHLITMDRRYEQQVSSLCGFNPDVSGISHGRPIIGL